jgi:hypothetical protein
MQPGALAIEREDHVESAAIRGVEAKKVGEGHAGLLTKLLDYLWECRGR